MKEVLIAEGCLRIKLLHPALIIITVGLDSRLLPQPYQYQCGAGKWNRNIQGHRVSKSHAKILKSVFFTSDNTFPGMFLSLDQLFAIFFKSHCILKSQMIVAHNKVEYAHFLQVSMLHNMREVFFLSVLVVLHIIFIYAFSRCFYPKRLPRESFTKVHRSLIITR